MPYELETEKLSRKLLNASQVPLLVSLGLHVLIYIYGFPTLLFKEEARKISDRVRTITLDPVQQSRLPDIESEVEVPYFNSSSLDEAAPPFALPLPPNFTPSALPPIPIPPGYRLSDFPPISGNIELPPLGITDLSALPLPPPLADFDLPQIPENTGDLPNQLPQPPTGEKPPEPEKIAPPPDTETKQPEEKKPTPEQIAAVRDQKLDKNIRDLSASLQGSKGSTSDAEAQRNYVDWLSKIEEANPEPVTIVGTYPRDACILRLEGTSVYGVVVNRDNTVVALDLLKGAKYSVFNEQAAKDVQENDFGNTSQKIRPYTVTVNYEYDAEICPSLTLPSLRKKEEAETKPKPEAPKPSPANEKPKPEAPKPAPEAKPEPKPASKPEAEVQPESKPEPTPEPETNPEAEKPQPEAESEEPKPLPSLRDRLRNTPLPDDDTIRDRLRRNPLPPK